MIEKVKLGELCMVVSGTTPKTGVSEYWDGDILWITPAELVEESFVVKDTVRKITDKAVKESALKSFPEGTVLLSSRAPIGKIAIAGKEMYCNQGFKNLICNDKLKNEYLYWFLKGKKEYLNSLGRGATFKEISKSIVENIRIPLPDVNKQIYISSLLNKCQSVIRLRNEQLKQLDNLIKSRFVELFGTPLLNDKGWDVITAGECCSIITDGSHFSPRGQDEGYPMLSVKDMRNDGFHYDTCKRVSEEDFQTLKKQGCIPQVNDVLISKDGSYFYYGFVLENYTDQAILSSIAMLRPELSIINSHYLRNYMLSERVVGLVSENYVTGAALKRVILKGIKQIPVMLPPIELQNQFADFVKQVDKLKFVV